jgi:Ca2+-binding RTX toxin-like protein
MSRTRWVLRGGAALLATVAVGALSVAPAQAGYYDHGKIDVDRDYISFRAAKNKVNKVTITRSGNVFTIDDRVRLVPGPGCVQVRGDKTRVRCTIVGSLAGATVGVTLENKNDYVINKTDVRLSVNGHSGNDTIIGGSAADFLHGGRGNDVIKGGGGADDLRGSIGNDVIVGGKGADSVDGGMGYDKCDISSSDTVTACEVKR